MLRCLVIAQSLRRSGRHPPLAVKRLAVLAFRTISALMQSRRDDRDLPLDEFDALYDSAKIGAEGFDVAYWTR